MSTPTPLYHQLLSLLSQYSKYKDFRHLKALAWMINALICSSKINLSEWESYVVSRANQAQSIERRWHRFVHNSRIKVRALYIPLVMAAISGWNEKRLYLALDTTVLWNRYCMIHLSLICGGRAVPFLWRVIEHKSSTVAFQEYKLMLRLSHRLLLKHPNVMLLADRGFANHQLICWLKKSNWHYCLRLPCDVTIHRARRHPIELKYLYPPKSEACLYHHVGLWLDGECRTNLVLANVKGAQEPWAVVTNEEPTLQTLWQYALRFRIEELFLDSKSGIFQLEEFFNSRSQSSRTFVSSSRLGSSICDAKLTFRATAHGMAVQLKGLRTQVDPHYRRGLSYLKIGIRWLKGVLHKGRDLFSPAPLFSQDTLPCFASKKDRQKYYHAIWFTRVSELKCLKV